MDKSYVGTLRAKVSLIEGGVKLEWLDEAEQKIVWTETICPKEDCAAVSQIVCTGGFEIRPGYFYDANGKRHFVMTAETGHIVVRSTPSLEFLGELVMRAKDYGHSGDYAEIREFVENLYKQAGVEVESMPDLSVPEDVTQN